MEPKLPDFHRDQKCLALTLFVSAGETTQLLQVEYSSLPFTTLAECVHAVIIITGAIWANNDSIVLYCPPRAAELTRKSLANSIMYGKQI